MRIAVYDVAAESGGALSVLENYHTHALSDLENEYLFIVSVAELSDTPSVKVYRAPQVKRSWLSRAAFDVFKAHKIIGNFKADEVISLQNTTVPFAKVKQTVYFHNLLPLQVCDMRFSLFKEPKLWVYQNIIGRVFIRSLQKADKVIVQTEWLARRCINRCDIDASKIRIEKPTTSIATFVHKSKKPTIPTFFYPSSAMHFKNHEVIFQACDILSRLGILKYRVLLTLSGNENARIASLVKDASEKGLPIELVGWLKKEEMANAYASATCLLFPSKLETLGLPLEEAKAFRLSVLAADLEYSHETLGCYDRAQYFEPDNYQELSELMKEVILDNQKV